MSAFKTIFILNHVLQDIVVGDIALLEPGEIAPVDGIFLDGHNVKCDESGATGESDAVRKMPYQDCISGEAHHKADCFIMSGSKIIEGVGRYLVVAVGQKSFNGRIMMGKRFSAVTDGINLSFGMQCYEATTQKTLHFRLNSIIWLNSLLSSAPWLVWHSSRH